MICISFQQQLPDISNIGCLEKKYFLSLQCLLKQTVDKARFSSIIETFHLSYVYIKKNFLFNNSTENSSTISFRMFVKDSNDTVIDQGISLDCFLKIYAPFFFQNIFLIKIKIVRRQNMSMLTVFR